MINDSDTATTISNRRSYWELVRETYAINRCMTRTLSTVYEYVFLWSSMFTTPIFIKLGMSANNVTFFMLLTGIAAAIFVAQGSVFTVSVGTALYLFAQVLDASDGNVARMTNTSSFFGRFIDGVVDIVMLLVLQISYAIVLFSQHAHPIFIWSGILAVAITPMHHLYYDRYSAFMRWINEEHNLHLQPYIKRCLSPRLNWMLNDLQYSCLICIPLLLYYGRSEWQWAIMVNYAISIITGLYFIIMHTYYASKVMRVKAKQK